MILKTTELKAALSKLSPLFKGHSIIPIVDNVMIHAIGDRVIIHATNMAETITLFIDSHEKNKEERILLPFHDLKPYVDLLNEVEVEIKSNSKDCEIEVKAGKAKVKMTGEKPEDFPILPEIENGQEVKMKVETFETMKEKILPFTSTDDLRPAMCGVHLKAASGKLRIEATDSHALAWVEDETELPEMDVIFRASAVEQIPILFEAETEITCEISNNAIIVSSKTCGFQSKLIDERFPATEGVIPTQHRVNTTMDKSILINEVKRANLFANEKERMLKFRMTVNKLTITAQNIDYGKEYKNDLDCEGSGDLELGLDAQILLKILGKVGSQGITITHHSAPEKPVIIQEDRLNFLQMPMLIRPTA